MRCEAKWYIEERSRGPQVVLADRCLLSTVGEILLPLGLVTRRHLHLPLATLPTLRKGRRVLAGLRYRAMLCLHSALGRD